MISKKDLESLAQMRLDDARTLFQGQRFSAAYYVAGDAVELGIKAVIAAVFQANAIPERSLVDRVYSHKLNDLLGVAGLRFKLEADLARDPNLAAAWGIASKWNEASRYEMNDQFAAAGMIEAVENPNHGVLQWLKKHW